MVSNRVISPGQHYAQPLSLRGTVRILPVNRKWHKIDEYWCTTFQMSYR